MFSQLSCNLNFKIFENSTLDLSVVWMEHLVPGFFIFFYFCIFSQSLPVSFFKVLLLFCFIFDLQWGLFSQWQEGQIVHRSCVPFLIQYIFSTVVLMCSVSSWTKRQNANILVNNGLIFLSYSLIFLELHPRISGPNETGLDDSVMGWYCD